VLPVVLVSNVVGQEFELHGTMKHTLLSGTKIAPAEISVSWNGSNWYIKRVTTATTDKQINPATPDLGILLAVDELANDGTNIYELMHFESPTPSSVEYKKNIGFVTNSWIGKMMLPGFPVYGFDPILKVIFYAYTSSAYLDSCKAGKIHRIELPEDADIRVNAKVVRLEDRLRLPREILFLTPDNSTNASIRSGSFTNLNGFEIPLSVEYKQYAHGQEVASHLFEVTQIAAGCARKSFVPRAAKENFTINDYRLSYSNIPIPPVQLRSQGLDWPSLNDAKGSKSYAALKKVDWSKVRRSPNEPKASPRTRFIFLAILFCGTAVCLVLLGRQLVFRRIPQ
jgi:hypothetical protein